MPDVLITGGDGFVGRAYKRYFAKHPEYNVRSIDIKSGEDCRDYFKTAVYQFDLVIHLAAIVGGRLTIEGDPLAVASDLAIDSDMFQWAVRTDQKKVIYFSSSAAYPISLQELAYEHKLSEPDIKLYDISSPDLSYGWAKLSGEMLAQYAWSQHGLHTYIFRPFSGYGEDQDLDYPFPTFIERIKSEDPVFQIWGDGKQVRDFIHVDDIVEATMKRLETGPELNPDPSYGDKRLNDLMPINLGWGIPINFKTLASYMMNIAGIDKTVELLKDKPVGVQYRCSDPTRMNRYYLPRISLAEGIERSLAY